MLADPQRNIPAVGSKEFQPYDGLTSACRWHASSNLMLGLYIPGKYSLHAVLQALPCVGSLRTIYPIDASDDERDAAYLMANKAQDDMP